MVITKFLYDVFVENTMWRGGGVPPITLTIKKGTRTSDSTFALRTVSVGGGVSSSKTSFPDLLTSLNKMAVSKFWLDAFWKLMGMGGVLLPSNNFWLIKRALALSIPNQIESFLKFLQQQVVIAKFLSDAFRENTRCGGYLLSDPFES